MNKETKVISISFSKKDLSALTVSEVKDGDITISASYTGLVNEMVERTGQVIDDWLDSNGVTEENGHEYEMKTESVPMGKRYWLFHNGWLIDQLEIVWEGYNERK